MYVIVCSKLFKTKQYFQLQPVSDEVWDSILQSSDPKYIYVEWLKKNFVPRNRVINEDPDHDEIVDYILDLVIWLRDKEEKKYKIKWTKLENY